jgi:hypothetical protein
MQPHKIVMGKMQGDRCLQVFKLLAESVGQTGKPSHRGDGTFWRDLLGGWLGLATCPDLKLGHYPAVLPQGAE